MGKPKIGKNMEFDPIEMIDKQAEVNRINQSNAWGSANYINNPDGTQSLVNELSPEMKELQKDQFTRAKEGTMKDPFGSLGESDTGRGIQGLMGAMFGKMKDRYMGEEGTSTSRHNNIGKGGGETAPSKAPLDAMAGSSGFGGNAVTGNMGSMNTAQKVRELEERAKLQQAMAGRPSIYQYQNPNPPPEDEGV